MIEPAEFELATKARGAGISSVPVAKGSCSVAILDLAKRHAAA